MLVKNIVKSPLTYIIIDIVANHQLFIERMSTHTLTAVTPFTSLHDSMKT